jgi:hypothetical protein
MELHDARIVHALLKHAMAPFPDAQTSNAAGQPIKLMQNLRQGLDA